MASLALIVEGGEVEAFPLLMRRLLHGMERYDISCSRPKNAHGCGNLTKAGGLEKFVQYCLLDKSCEGILILMDCDKVCPVDLAREFVTRVRVLNPAIPVAVCIANHEYEAWFVASSKELCEVGLRLPADFQYPADVDAIGSPKAWIDSRMGSDGYSETMDQPRFTSRINFERAAELSRSFRHLRSALGSLLQSVDSGVAEVIPTGL